MQVVDRSAGAPTFTEFLQEELPKVGLVPRIENWGTGQCPQIRIFVDELAHPIKRTFYWFTNWSVGEIRAPIADNGNFVITVRQKKFFEKIEQFCTVYENKSGGKVTIIV